jgi:hypothetical protein
VRLEEQPLHEAAEQHLVEHAVGEEPFAAVGEPVETVAVPDIAVETAPNGQPPDSAA